MDLKSYSQADSNTELYCHISLQKPCKFGSSTSISYHIQETVNLNDDIWHLPYEFSCLIKHDLLRFDTFVMKNFVTFQQVICQKSLFKL
jgi:hypothetical protein